jgi:hypothetical protein
MNISHSSPLRTLVLPSTIPHAGFAHAPIRARWTIGVGLVIWVTLWAVGSINVGIAFVFGFYTDTALSMARAGSAVGVLFGVLVTLRAMSLVGFPAVAISNFVSSILLRSAPIQVVKVIIVRIVITMTRLHPLGSRLDKSFKHQRMNSSLVRLPIAIQGATEVPATLNPANPHLRQHRAGRVANLPVVRDLIVGKVGDGNPAFILSHQIRLPYCRELI